MLRSCKRVYKHEPLLTFPVQAMRSQADTIGYATCGTSSIFQDRAPRFCPGTCGRACQAQGPGGATVSCQSRSITRRAPMCPGLFLLAMHPAGVAYDLWHLL